MTVLRTTIWISMVLCCCGREKALLEVILHEKSENGEIETYEYKLTGHFTPAGSVSGAEGTMAQVSDTQSVLQ